MSENKLKTNMHLNFLLNIGQGRVLMPFGRCTALATTAKIFLYVRWLEEIAPEFLVQMILIQTGEDYRNCDLLDQTARLIEIFGVDGAAQIVGCP
jgi:hypothetical protein